jgi:hypothetical protein
MMFPACSDIVISHERTYTFRVMDGNVKIVVANVKGSNAAGNHG